MLGWYSMLPEKTTASSLPRVGWGTSGRAFGYTVTLDFGEIHRIRSASFLEVASIDEKSGSHWRSSLRAALPKTRWIMATAPTSTFAQRAWSRLSTLCRLSTVRAHTGAIAL